MNEGDEGLEISGEKLSAAQMAGNPIFAPLIGRSHDRTPPQWQNQEQTINIVVSAPSLGSSHAISRAYNSGRRM
jgi:hypothetical protein